MKLPTEFRKSIKHMDTQQFKSRKQFAQELGMCTKTLMRKLRALKYELPPGLISPERQVEIWNLLNEKEP
jgi:hypothetical protein